MASSDLVGLVVQHLRALLESVPGTKVLLLDHDTTAAVSTALSQSDILQKEVFLVDRIDASLPQGRFEHINCVCFLRPTSENLLLLLQLVHQQAPPRRSAKERGRGQPGGVVGAIEMGKASARGGSVGDLSRDPNKSDQQKPTAHFKELHIFFSAPITREPQLLRRLAKQDEAEKIVQVQEMYVDLCVLSPHLFTLNIPAVAPLQQQELSLWTPYEESVFQRMIDGVFSCIALFKVFPALRYQASSALCKRLAAALQVRLGENLDLLERTGRTENGGGGGKHTGGSAAASKNRVEILIVDRREDPVTPLLNQWTYRAMLHELIGIKNNRVDLRRVSGASSKEGEEQQYVMSPMQDKFYRDHVDSNFGDLGIAVQQYVRDYQAKTESSRGAHGLESLEDMQRFIDSYPEIRKLSGNVSKHVAVIHALSQLVNERMLLEVSSLEQEIACREAKNEHFAQVSEFLQNSRVSNMDKLRLVLLFSLRYEGDPRVQPLREGLRAAGIEDEEIKLLQAITQYAGRDTRDADLFSNKNFFAVAKNSIQRGLKGTSNVYTQHKSLLWYTVESLIKGRLSVEKYPVLCAQKVDYANGSAATPASSFQQATREKPQTVVVFMVGGATYEEARDMTELSKQSGCRIVLGGTCFHNSRSFLADVSQIIKGHTLLSGTVPSLPGGAMVWGGGSKSPHAAAGSDCQTELVAVRTR